jgi:hypothetical protein
MEVEVEVNILLKNKQHMTVHMGVSTHDGLHPSIHIWRFLIHFYPRRFTQVGAPTHDGLGRAALVRRFKRRRLNRRRRPSSSQ